MEDYWRTIYFQIIDSLVNNLEKRFSSESLNIAIGIDNFLKLNFNNSTCFIEHYKELLNIDIDAIKCEMKVAKKCLLRLNEENEINIDGLKQVVNRVVYPNLFKLVLLALTIPISSASCERSFSAMRRIKNWLRTSMEQDRITNLSVIYIERSISNEIDSNTILKEFVKNYHKLQL
ncbi:Uncharacterized protein FWK35_00037310 [Aphis craccivora]|uniref:HAT C-terminal dimerisation domain-containing protein n=1 Tax=Aphis craccivora TaxID=307492 RepID=A0A6G0VT14_APHCR|nr:Uncharacterized protein FWK35_00037310 [Aphis craccivora]